MLYELLCLCRRLRADVVMNLPRVGSSWKLREVVIPMKDYAFLPV
jgi:hypothetical protein